MALCETESGQDTYRFHPRWAPPSIWPARQYHYGSDVGGVHTLGVLVDLPTRCC
ncbi:hypothetical protein KCP77_05340 [Salmonella enterica subsp. enterica]|nr:hypothetical protein KCP77_05340 [Salmonella enterica subsp. enterica]